MPLVALKNLFIWRKFTPPPPKEQGPKHDQLPALERLRSGTSSLTATEVDLESQATRAATQTAERPNPARRFRVDARVISDATIGLSDGLTVPFALTAGLSALGDTRVVIFGGLAELIAGAISMGLGGYLGAKGEAASYRETRIQTSRLINGDRQAVLTDVKAVFEPFEIPAQTLDDLTKHLSVSPRLVDFVMQFRHCTQEPASSRAFTSALTIALGYFLGGLLPLIPYFCVNERDLYKGLYISIGVMAFALFSFGYVKTCIVTGWQGSRCIRQGCFGGIQMVLIGGAAAAAAMGLVKAFNQIL